MLKMPTEKQSRLILIGVSFIGSWVLALITISMWLNDEIGAATAATLFFFVTSFRSGVIELRNRQIY